MRFRSKIDWWFHLVVWASLAASVWGLVVGVQANVISTIVIGVVMLLIEVFLVLPIYFTTFYSLDDSALHIRCGLCMNKQIAYNDITFIYETRDPSASVGLSLDRISVNYSRGEVLISPKEKQEFIRLLTQRTARNV